MVAVNDRTSAVASRRRSRVEQLGKLTRSRTCTSSFLNYRGLDDACTTNKGKLKGKRAEFLIPIATTRPSQVAMQLSQLRCRTCHATSWRRESSVRSSCNGRSVGFELRALTRVCPALIDIIVAAAVDFGSTFRRAIMVANYGAVCSDNNITSSNSSSAASLCSA